jgi:hypothetical protein
MSLDINLAGRSQGSTGYMNVVAIIIELYVLESAWLLLMAIFLHHAVIPFFSRSVRLIEVSPPESQYQQYISKRL